MRLQINAGDFERLCDELNQAAFAYSLVRYSPAQHPPHWELDVDGNNLASVHFRNDGDLILLDTVVYAKLFAPTP